MTHSRVETLIMNSSEHENAQRRLRDASSQLLRTDAVQPESPTSVPLSGEKTSILHPRCEAPSTIPRRWRPSGYNCGAQRSPEGATLTWTPRQPRSVIGAQLTSSYWVPRADARMMKPAACGLGGSWGWQRWYRGSVHCYCGGGNRWKM